MGDNIFMDEVTAAFKTGDPHSEKTDNDINEPEREKTISPDEGLLYKVDQIPPWYLTILFGFQVCLSNLSTILVIAVIISDNICADQDFKSRVFQSACVLAGGTTIAQNLLGVRLPIFHGPTLAGVLPFIDAVNDQRWNCGVNTTLLNNGTGLAPGENAWDTQWRKVQGGLLMGAIFVTVVGLTGVGSIICRLIRPISVAVLFLLLGVFLWTITASLGSVNWGVAMFSLFVVVICSQYINRYSIPCPTWRRATGFGITWIPIFQLFSVFIAILLTWILCVILTVTGALSNDPNGPGYHLRTDRHNKDIADAPLFRIPYPGQFGWMEFDLNYSIQYIPIMLTLIIDLIADCHQYSIVSEVPRPPAHAMNRGIMTLGIGAIFASLLGAGHPTSSYGEMLGIIKITRVASRSASVMGGFILILLGIFGKFGALLVSMPKPVLFGPAFMATSFIMGAAFESLKSVDLGRRRNQAVLGMSMFFGCVIPFWFRENRDALQTGSPLADEIITGVLRIPFLIGVFVAAFLDFVLPGQREPLPDDCDTNMDTPQAVSKRRIEVYAPPFARFCIGSRFFRMLPFMPKS